MNTLEAGREVLEGTETLTSLAPQISKKALWSGRILSGIPAAFLLVDAGMKVANASVVVQGSIELGYPPESMFGIGIVLLLCTILYLIPRTSILGAIFLTGYLGGAIATHVRVGNPLFSHVLFPIYVAAMLWGGLYLRDRTLRALVPVRS